MGSSDLSGGVNVDKVTFYWYETSTQTGFTAQFVNGNGNLVLEIGRNNPQWELNYGGGSKRVYDSDGYNRWIKYFVDFHWTSGTFDYAMKDMQSGIVAIGTEDLINSTGLEKLKFNDSNWGSADALRVDDVTIS